MKKHLFYAGLAALALASCSQDETTSVDQSGAIGFRTALDKATRSVTTKANMGSFNVTAFKADNTAANYFTDLEVKSTDNGNTWNTTKTYYWPAYDLKFTAYAPIDLANKVSIDKDGQKITDFQPESSIKQQKDVVVAFNQGGKTDHAAGVPMYFKHILSQVQVKAKCVNENLEIKVVGVKLGNVLSKGTFNFPQAKTEAGTDLFSNWSANTLAQFGVSDASKAVTLGTEAKSIMFDDTSDKTNNFLMIPQQLTAYDKNSHTDGAYIAVLCQISSKDGSNLTRLYPAEGENAYAYSAVAINTKWEPGKKYVYTLTYGDHTGSGSNGGGGIVPPNQENPDPENPVTPTNPADPTPNKPGDKILDDPISFTVDVQEWEEETSDLNM